MKSEIWALINQQYVRYRSAWAERVPQDEIDEAFKGLPSSPDYREFVLRYGGGLVGTHPFYGLRLAEDMGKIEGKATAPEITLVFRSHNFPGVQEWLVLSTDGFGNPIGMASDGAIWISDGARLQVQKLADNFEGFIRKWALRLAE